MIADRCEALGVPLATLSDETHAAIDAQKMFSRVGNPLDMGIFGGMRRAGQIPALLMADPGVSVALGLMHSMNPWQGDPIRDAMAKGREMSGKPLLIVSPGGMPASERESYTSRGMDVFTETDILLEGIGAMLTPPPAAIPTAMAGAASVMPDRQLTEPESLNLLLGFGVRGVPTVECPSLAHALSAARAVGYPVVLKGVVEGVAHKSDKGLVHVNLTDIDALEAAYASLGCPNVIVQKMIKGDLEAIAGVTRSEGVGLVLLAGLGGIYAEALGDAVVWPIPVSRAAIEEKLADSVLGRVLASDRWRHEGAANAMVDLLLALQRAALAIGDRLEAIDINPVILGAAGAVAVDALVIPRA